MDYPKYRYQFENQSAVLPAVYKAIETLLRNWDRVDDETHSYLKAFHPDATLILSPHKATGHDAIKDMRRATIHPDRGPIINVQHTFGRLYVLPNEQSGRTRSINFTGVVDYTVKGGEVVSEGFSTTFELVQTAPDEYQIMLARIYIDNYALTNALTAQATGAVA